MNSRRLVLCLDGTWNNAYALKRRDEGDKVFKPSNVLKTARAVVPRDASQDPQQSVYYHVGVGSLAKYPGFPNRLLAGVDRTLGGGWGAGFEENVEQALEFLVQNHEPGDEVFVFGFSRGAATAQAATRFLDWAGGLPLKHDAYYLPLLFHEYVSKQGKEPFQSVLERINDKRRAAKTPLDPLAPFQPVDVVFLGVWDTVVALGPSFRTRGPVRSFHVGDEPARCVRHARQALATDEVRYDFRPEIWRDTAAPGQTLEQRWFAGVHSNVGGGYVDDGLANLALHWMLKEAKAQGLVVDGEFLRHYQGYAQDRLYRSESLLYRLLDGLRGRAGRGRRKLVDRPPGARLALDRSVVWRIDADPREKDPRDPGKLRHPDLRTLYRPENVLRFLAEQPDLDAYLTSIGITPADLPADVRKRISELRPGQGRRGRFARLVRRLLR